MAEQLDQIQLEMGPDFFVLCIFTTRATSATGSTCIKKADYQFGQWVGGFANGANYQEIDLGTSNVQVDESCLVAGTAFAALHVGGTSQLYRFRYKPGHPRSGPRTIPFPTTTAPRTSPWRRGATPWPPAFSIPAPRTVRGESIIYYLKGDYTWGSYDQFDPTTSFTWDPDYAGAYWQMGPGFAVGTCLTDSGSAQLQILHWQRNYADFSDRSTTVTGGSAHSQVAGSVIVNGGTMLRYDGSSWQSTQIGWEENSDFVAVTDDAVLRARKSGSVFHR